MVAEMDEKPQDSFFGSTWLVSLIVIVLFVLGFGIRMVDLTDLPLDFHPTRQFLSAIKARGMYYQFARDIPEWQREMAIQEWKDADVFEPAVNETVVAGLYLLFGEHLWLARIASSVYWLLGGLALFALARRIASVDGAILAGRPVDGDDKTPLLFLGALPQFWQPSLPWQFTVTVRHQHPPLPFWSLGMGNGA